MNIRSYYAAIEFLHTFWITSKLNNFMTKNNSTDTGQIWAILKHLDFFYCYIQLEHMISVTVIALQGLI